ncbi:MAG: hypothetical protein HZB50_19375 [Chloroflexi bacterium]|nr:hypothetical protein [Chloroflexota bacterium]
MKLDPKIPLRRSIRLDGYDYIVPFRGLAGWRVFCDHCRMAVREAFYPIQCRTKGLFDL